MDRGYKRHTKGPCEPPFWKDPTILYRQALMEYKPVCDHSAWNFTARVMLIGFIAGTVMSVFGGAPFLFLALFFAFLTVMIVIGMTPPVSANRPDPSTNTDEDGYQIISEPPAEVRQPGPVPFVAPTREHFVNGGGSKGAVKPVVAPVGVEEVDAHPYSGPSLPEYTPPTSRNLFMNVLLDEMKYNPTRPEAAPVDHPAVKQALDDYFRVQWFSDPTDVFGKNQGQRQFITQPSTTVPNGQGEFADWLYRIPGKTCKEGGREACLSGSDGGAIPWLNHAS